MGINDSLSSNNLLLTSLFIPVSLYFLLTFISKITFLKKKKKKQMGVIMHFLVYYSLLFINVLFISVVLNYKAGDNLLILLVLMPLEIYFIFKLFLKFKKLLVFKNKKRISSMEENIFNFKMDEVLVLEKYDGVREIDKRKFFKLAAGAGVGVIAAMLLNPQKAGAAFFGSVPGPGTVGIKDSAGDLVDPAIKSPTDGYGIMNVDDDGTHPNYYGFVNKDGAWYIVREAADGSFSYVKGNSGYDWSERASESYASYDSTF